MTMMIDSVNTVVIDKNRWAWWDAPATLEVFLYLLRSAFTKDRPYRDIILHRGDVYATLDGISADTGLSVSVIRTALKHLTLSRDVEFIPCGYHRIIRILSYDHYVKRQPEICGGSVLPSREGKDDKAADIPKAQSLCPPENTAPAKAVSASGKASPASRQKRAKKHTKPVCDSTGDAAIPESQDKNQKAFLEFWDAYPRKVNKPLAEEAWESLNPGKETIGKIMAALARMTNSEQWKTGNGRYVPHPANWLRGRRWEDDPSEADLKFLAPPQENSANKSRNRSTVPAQQYEQRDYSEIVETPEEMMARLRRGVSLRGET